MSEQLELLEEVGARLDAAGFVWMLSGSVALNFYALPRMTRDIDLVIDLGLPDLARFLALFPPERWYRDEATVREAVRRRDMFNLIELPRAMKLGFMVRKDTEYRRTELARRRRVPLGPGAVWVAAPEDLALSKLALGPGEPLAPAARRRARVARRRAARPGVPAPLGARAGCGRAPERGLGVSDGRASKDTPPEVERVYRELLLARPGVERMRLGADMFQAARELALAGLRAEGVAEQELLPRLFLRFHGHELPPEVCAAVVARLRAAAAADGGRLVRARSLDDLP